MNIEAGNIEAGTAPSPAQIKRLNKAATRWLATHDPNHKNHQAVAKLRRQRAARQTRVHRP